MSHILDNLVLFDGWMPQNTPEWEKARLGRITASNRAGRILSNKPTTWNQVLRELRHELTTGEPWSQFKGNRHTQHGHDFEEQAFDAYCFEDLDMSDRLFNPGMTVHPECPILSATPDFLEGDDASGQIKCPSKLDNHMRMVYSGMAPQYVSQVQCEALVCGKSEIVFVSYHPNAAPAQQLFTAKLDYSPSIGNLILERSQEIYWHLVNDTSYGEGQLAIEAGVPSLF